jgi:hypothetical protein
VSVLQGTQVWIVASDTVSMPANVDIVRMEIVYAIMVGVEKTVDCRIAKMSHREEFVRIRLRSAVILPSNCPEAAALMLGKLVSIIISCPIVLRSGRTMEICDHRPMDIAITMFCLGVNLIQIFLPMPFLLLLSPVGQLSLPIPLSLCPFANVLRTHWFGADAALSGLLTLLHQTKTWPGPPTGIVLVVAAIAIKVSVANGFKYSAQLCLGFATQYQFMSSLSSIKLLDDGLILSPNLKMFLV